MTEERNDDERQGEESQVRDAQDDVPLGYDAEPSDESGGPGTGGPHSARAPGGGPPGAAEVGHVNVPPRAGDQVALERAIALVAGGASVRFAAAKEHVSRSTLARRVRELGIATNEPGEYPSPSQAGPGTTAPTTLADSGEGDNERDGEPGADVRIAELESRVGALESERDGLARECAALRRDKETLLRVHGGVLRERGDLYRERDDARAEVDALTKQLAWMRGGFDGCNYPSRSAHLRFEELTPIAPERITVLAGIRTERGKDAR